MYHKLLLTQNLKFYLREVETQLVLWDLLSFNIVPTRSILGHFSISTSPWSLNNCYTVLYYLMSPPHPIFILFSDTVPWRIYSEVLLMGLGRWLSWWRGWGSVFRSSASPWKAGHRGVCLTWALGRWGQKGPWGLLALRVSSGLDERTYLILTSDLHMCVHRNTNVTLSATFVARIPYLCLWLTV